MCCPFFYVIQVISNLFWNDCGRDTPVDSLIVEREFQAVPNKKEEAAGLLRVTRFCNAKVAIIAIICNVTSGKSMLWRGMCMQINL